MKKHHWIVLGFILGIMVSGCVPTEARSGNVGQVQSFPVPSKEASWIRNGEPIEFEGELWYPVDGIEALQDSEVLLAGEYRGVQFFVDKIDVRPYNRLYTKFDRNAFRFFEKKKQQ